MKIIVFAATKGGTGKTTLAFNAGLEAARHGTVFLADMDPQRAWPGFARRADGTWTVPGTTLFCWRKCKASGAPRRSLPARATRATTS